MVQHTAPNTRIKRIPKGKETPLQIWNVPQSVKDKFKIRCIQKGTTMREAILEFMRTY